MRNSPGLYTVARQSCWNLNEEDAGDCPHLVIVDDGACVVDTTAVRAEVIKQKKIGRAWKRCIVLEGIVGY